MTDEHRKLLEEAAALVDTVVAAHDVRKHTCTGCGVDRALNYREYRRAIELSALAHRLRRFAGQRD